MSVENKAFPLTVRELVGLVVPMPTHALELITTTFEPPPTFEKRAMFEPIVPVPTLRIFEAKMFFVVRAFDAKMLPVTLMVEVAFERVRVFAKMLVVERAFDAKMFPDTPTVGPFAVTANPPAEKRVAKTLVVEIFPVTLRVATFAFEAKRVVRFDVPFRLVVPETIRLVRVPTDTIFP